MLESKKPLGAAAILLFSTAVPAWAGTIDDQPVVSVSGDGLIFSDPAEGVLPPGMKAVTFKTTRYVISTNPTVFGYYDPPIENIVTDFSTLTSRGEVPNCLMANNPDIYCDSESGSGKRIKTWLTGTDPFDITLSTTPSIDHPVVDYLTFGKTSNFTGARMTGFSVELLDANGDPMGDRAAAEAVLFNLDPDVIANLHLNANLPDGLFGNGGNEGDIGFFSDSKALLTLAEGVDVLDFATDAGTDLFTEAFYTANFGDAFLDDTMVPDGLFWDDNADPSDEAALIAWNNPAGGGWTYGNIALPADQAARAQEIADALGVTVGELNYVPGGLVPPAIVALAEENGLFEVDAIEDLRNANLNFTITVGNVDEGEFTIRIAPVFSPIIYEAGNEAQFRIAAALDAANVPYFGADPAYLTMLNDIMALSTTAERQQALTDLSFTSGAGFLGSSFATARDQVFALGSPMRENGEVGTTSTNGNSSQWVMGDGATGFVSLSGRTSETDATASNPGYETNSRAIWAGFEKETVSGMSFGLMIGAGSADTDMNAGLGSVDADMLGFGIYGRAPLGSNGAVQALIGYQDLSFDSVRNIAIASAVANGKTDGSVFLASLKGSWMMRSGALNWGPMASLDFYDVSIDGFTETGAGIWNQTVAGISTNYTLATLGIQGDMSWQSGGNTYDLFGHLAYTSQSGGDAAIATTMGALPGFTSPVDGMNDDWVDIGLGLSATIGKTAQGETKIGAEYQGALFGGGYESHGLRLFLQSTF